MAMIGAFLGGPDTTLPVGKAGISLCVNTTDRLNLATASFVVTASGFNQTVQADASGRAYIEVDAGKTYTVTLNHQGSYENDGPQTVIAESRMQYGVFFDLFYYPAASTVVRVHTKAGATVTATRQGDRQQITATADTSDGKNGYAYLRGLSVGDTWLIIANGSEQYLKVEDIYYELDIGSETTIYGIRIQESVSDPAARCVYIEENASWPKGTRNSVGNWLTGKTPFTDIKPVMFDGTTWTELDKRNLAQDVNGSPVDITTLGNDVFTEVPTWWLSITSDGTYKYIRFADKQVDGTYKKLASLWKGEDVGMFHRGCFHAYNSSSKTYSSRNRSPTVNVSTEGFRASCQARGEGYDKDMWHMNTYMHALCTLFFGTTNPQTILRGYVGASAKTTENVITFDNDLGIAGSSSGTQMMSFLWVNAEWGNVYSFVGGAKTDSSYRLQTLDNGEPDNTTGENYVSHDTSPQSSRSGYISEMDMQSTEVGFLPKACSGSSSTYWADYGRVVASGFPGVGGGWSDGDYAGPFYARFDYSASYAYSSISSRLSYRAGRKAQT